MPITLLHTCTIKLYSRINNEGFIVHTNKETLFQFNYTFFYDNAFFLQKFELINFRKNLWNCTPLGGGRRRKFLEEVRSWWNILKHIKFIFVDLERKERNWKI